MPTTHKGPNMPPSKFHGTLWRPSILPKWLKLILLILLHQSMCQAPIKPKRMHQEWANIVIVEKGGGLGPCVAQAKGFACPLHCARVVQDIQVK